MRYWIMGLVLVACCAAAAPVEAQRYGCRGSYGVRYSVGYRGGYTSFYGGSFYPYRVNRTNYFGPVPYYYRAAPYRYPGLNRSYNYRGPGYGF